MTIAQKDIITRLQKDILELQGYKSPPADVRADMGLGPLAKAFPNEVFPTAAVHEFVSEEREESAAVSGFVTGLLSGLMRGEKICIWISSKRTLFPPALQTFGVNPSHVIFIDVKREKDLLWVMEEALKCGGLGAVVGEIGEIDFTASRRLQLAVEKSRITGFLLRHNPRNLNTIACVSRWNIKPVPSSQEAGLPGVGFPRWKVTLLKIRNGKPGSWQLQWSAGSFHYLYEKGLTAVPSKHIKKTG